MVLRLTTGHGVCVVLAVTDLVLVVHFLHFFDLELREAVDQKRGRVVGLARCAILVEEWGGEDVLLRIFGLFVDRVTEEFHQVVAGVTRQVGEGEQLVFFPVDVLQLFVGHTDSLETHDRGQGALGIVNQTSTSLESTTNHRLHEDRQGGLEVVRTRGDASQRTYTAIENGLTVRTQFVVTGRYVHHTADVNTRTKQGFIDYFVEHPAFLSG